MNRVREIVIREQGQLRTLMLALLVFAMALAAMNLRQSRDRSGPAAAARSGFHAGAVSARAPQPATANPELAALAN